MEGGGRMGGMFGIGGNSAKTDRGNQLAATQGLWSVFNYGLPAGQKEETQAQATLGGAQDYFNKLLRAGRTDTALRSAPAINARVAADDAARRREASAGTGRTGATVADNREASSRTAGDVSNIINANLVGGQQQGAEGLERVAGARFADARNLLGLGAGADEAILNNATESRKVSQKIHDEAVASYGAALGDVLAGFLKI